MRKYNIKTIKNYPDDGNHLKCDISLPFFITKGEDGFYYRDENNVQCKYNLDDIDNPKRKIDKRWICYVDRNNNSFSISLLNIFKFKISENLDEIVDYCLNIYKESLYLEILRLADIKKEILNEPEIAHVDVLKEAWKDIEIAIEEMLEEENNLDENKNLK